MANVTRKNDPTTPLYRFEDRNPFRMFRDMEDDSDLMSFTLPDEDSQPRRNQVQRAK